MSRRKRSKTITASRKRSFGNWLIEEWTGLVAIAISVSSLAVAIGQYQNAKLHDQPRLAYSYYYDETGAGWRISNTGLGPARLRGFKLMVDGKPQNGFDDFLASLGLSGDFNFTNPRVGDLWPTGHENILFWVKPGTAADLLKRTWGRVTIEACYCSIHDQCWLFNSRNLPDQHGDTSDDSCRTFQGQEHNRWWNG